MKNKMISLTVNGVIHKVSLPPNITLLRALREQLGYVEVKNGCENGDCGACTVMMDGKAINSCMVLAWQADGAVIMTVKGLGSTYNPHPLQEAFADTNAAQCGYCTPGMILSAKALLDENPHPTENEIRHALSGNLCRCTGYGQVIEAVQIAAEKMAGGKK
jgi:carbon-monoxide dehydrogenase small subunit